MQATKLNKLTYEFKYKKNEPLKVMLMSDIHFDNPKCDRELFFTHLKKAKREGAKVAINGDLFCIMQGKYDPRRSKKDVRPEHNVAHYIDAVIDDTVEQLSPYADTIIFIGEGNHETAILKSLETDVLSRFVDKFNERNKVNVLKGGYRGWLIFRKEIAPGKYVPYKIYYNHGYGGGGEVTKGLIQHSRMNMHVEGADAIWMGHVHEMYINTVNQEYFDNNPSCYCPKIRTIYNIRTSAYKEEFAGCTGGFHIEKGRAAKPLGGIFLNLENIKDGNTHTLFPTYTIWAA